MNIEANPAPLAYSVKDACRVTSLGVTRVYQLIHEGRLDARKIGRRTVVTAASIRRLIGEAA